MPKLSQWAVKLSLVHFLLGIVLGATMLAAKAGFGDLGMLNHRATHIHLMLFGWLVQLVNGRRLLDSAQILRGAEAWHAPASDRRHRDSQHRRRPQHRLAVGPDDGRHRLGAGGHCLRTVRRARLGESQGVWGH